MTVINVSNKEIVRHVVVRIALIGRPIKKLRCSVAALLINWPRGVRCPSRFNRGGGRGRAVPSVKVQRGSEVTLALHLVPSTGLESGGPVGVERECCGGGAVVTETDEGGSRWMNA